jgi:hypothetical protein
MQRNTQQHNHQPAARRSSPITSKQHVILELLYRFRFLDRTHIQQFLNHKDHKTILIWLRDLTDKNYITRHYTRSFPHNTKPAVYHLNAKAIALLRARADYDPKALRKRYREHLRSADFIASSLLLASLALNLRAQPTNHSKQTLAVQSDYHALPHADLLAELSPHAFITKAEGTTTKQYLLEILPASSVRTRKRIKQYIGAYASNTWEAKTGTPFPTILLACADLPALITTKRTTKNLLQAVEDESPEILVTTAEELRTHGLSGEIWEETA